MSQILYPTMVSIDIDAPNSLITSHGHQDLLTIETRVDIVRKRPQLKVLYGEPRVQVYDGYRLDIYINIADRPPSQRALGVELQFPKVADLGCRDECQVTAQRLHNGVLRPLETTGLDKPWIAHPDISGAAYLKDTQCEWYVLTCHRDYAGTDPKPFLPQTLSVLCGIHTKPPR